MPKPIHQGDLDRIPSVEPDTQFPDRVEVRLVWGDTYRAHHISAEEFFGWSGYGAPMSGDMVIRHIDRLRRQGKPVEDKPSKKRKP